MKIMIVEFECTEINDELMLDIYSTCKIIKVRQGPNGFILLQIQGSEINLFNIWIKHWSPFAKQHPIFKEEFSHFKDHIVNE